MKFVWWRTASFPSVVQWPCASHQGSNPTCGLFSYVTPPVFLIFTSSYIKGRRKKKAVYTCWPHLLYIRAFIWPRVVPSHTLYYLTSIHTWFLPLPLTKPTHLSPQAKALTTFIFVQARLHETFDRAGTPAADSTRATADTLYPHQGSKLSKSASCFAADTRSFVGEGFKFPLGHTCILLARTLSSKL